MPIARRTGMAKQRAGFTLVELMIVIAIMGGMAALLAPGLGEWAVDGRASSASEDLVRLSRHVRARTQETGLAHLIVFSSASGVSGGLGRFLVYEGMNDHCRQTPWPQTLNGTVDKGHAPVDGLDMGAPSYNLSTNNLAPTKDDTKRQVIAISAADPNGAMTTVALCYEPGGATLLGASDGSSIGYAFTPQTAPITFTIRRTLDSVQHGVDREVVFPPGGSARFRI